MALNCLPIAIRVRVSGNRLEEDGRQAEGERAVDDVRVAGDPTRIGDTAVDYFFFALSYTTHTFNGERL